jgi:meso-butanediol dehydrogenase / (S,S)-butanediol dehydrogenase / diacetyl reductase
MSMERFAGRTAWITGAGSGLGRATAAAFAVEGARVWCADVNADGVAGTIAAIRTAGGTADGGPCDVTDAGAVGIALEQAAARLDGVHVVVNAAGLGRSARVEEIDEAEWRRVLDVNLTGPFLVCKAALPYLLARPGGAIVNVASSAGMRGQAYAAHYAASKAALINLTRSLALEFVSRGLRVNAIAPAGILSPFIRNFIPREDFEPQLVAYYSPPIPHQMSTPEEIAKAILFLASGETPGITGAVLVADWGTLA